ncbi:putative peptide modification system cyclase [Coralloluteibacterium stylophorae]|uniref:Peptide modification system cyclase n=1 Tax=Coralloluteibacterium stylophorae TaxID=1776034 RepID=A0A8J8AWM4_9GAMM|nr:putative peptide modification system cyclase [Coralloluteibacterium stylophorae]MBS7457468.1 putative peptide modification system cyclase [Coralloluteibacterium stylophorae]
MEAVMGLDGQVRPASPGADAVAQLRTVLLCDLADSTALIERVGDRRAVELMRAHDRLLLGLLEAHAGRLIDKSDGCLALFDRPIRAVAFALAYQRGLRELSAEEGVELAARVGIHVGDVLVWDNAPEAVAVGAKPVEVEGLAKPVAARLMQLALPGQILLSGMAQNLAQRAAPELGADAEQVRWRTHGRYRFKGTTTPTLVHEVGAPGLSPLRAPPSQPKARREVPLWRRPQTMILEAIAASVLVGVMFFALRSTPAIAFQERDWIVLADLQNLTGDPRFDDSLETALRISLEQSNFVNVLPDLRVRDTLKRMQRDPGAPIDRSVAAEIAQREGAKAVVLPVVAEVGGRLQVGLQLLDPASQAVVHTELATASAPSTIVASLGGAVDRMREHLGDAPKTTPALATRLESATTDDIDALRAYTLGQRAFARGDLDRAEQHYLQATTLDDSFAMAWIGLGRIHQARHEVTAATALVRKALELEDRLTARERLYALAHLAVLEAQPDAVMRWKALADLYPDFAAASLNVALFADTENDYDLMREYAAAAAGANSPVVRVALYLRAAGEVLQGRPAQAEESYRRAHDLGMTGLNEYPAALAVLQGNSSAARRLLDPMSANGSDQSARYAMARTAVAIASHDEAGLAQEVLEGVAALNAPSGDAEPAAVHAAVLRVMTLAAAARMQPDGAPSLGVLAGRLADLAGQEKAPSDSVLYTLLAAYLYCDAGQGAKALQLADDVDGDQLRVSAFLANLDAIVRAKVALAERSPERALRLMEPYRDTRALVTGRLVVADALSAAGKPGEAAAELRLIATQPERAWYEWAGQGALRAENVVNWRIASQRIADEPVGMAAR